MEGEGPEGRFHLSLLLALAVAALLMLLLLLVKLREKCFLINRENGLGFICSPKTGADKITLFFGCRSSLESSSGANWTSSVLISVYDSTSCSSGSRGKTPILHLVWAKLQKNKC